MSKTHKEKYKSAFKDKNYGKKHSKSSKDDRPSESKSTEDKESEDAWDVKKYSDKFRNKSPAEISPSVGSRYYGEHSKETNKDQLNLDDDIIEDRSRIAIDWEESENKRFDERVNKGKKRREVDEDHYFIENTKNIRKRQKNTEEATTEETTINKNDYYKNKSHEDNLETRQEDQQNKNFVKRNSLISKNKQKKYEDEKKDQSKIKRADYNIIEQYNERRAKGNKQDVIEVVENRLDKRTNEILFVNDEENEINHGKNYKGKQKSFDPENKSYHETTSRDNEKYYSKETDYYREKRHNTRQRDNFFENETHLNRRPRSSRNNFDENDSYPERRLYKDNGNPDKRSSNEYQSKRPSRSSGDSEKEYSRGSNFHHERRPGQVKEKHMPHKERFDDRNQMARRKRDSEVERIKSPSGEKRKNMTNLSGNNIKDSTLPARDPAVITSSQKKTVDLLTSKTGGAYIPPAKLRMMQAQITDKSSAAYQRIAWEALKKSIHGHINKINTSNIGIIVRELFKENVVRGRGLLCRSIIQSQAASPTFTHVYAALVAVINTKGHKCSKKNSVIERRIVDFHYSLECIQAINHKGFNCKISNMNNTGETRNGFCSTLHLKCKMCGVLETLHASNTNSLMNVNTAMVAGIINTGQGFPQLEELSTVLDMPCMDNPMYQKIHQEIGKHPGSIAPGGKMAVACEEVALAVKAKYLTFNLVFNNITVKSI